MYTSSIQNNTGFFAEAQKSAVAINSCWRRLNEWNNRRVSIFSSPSVEFVKLYRNLLISGSSGPLQAT